MKSQTKVILVCFISALATPTWASSLPDSCGASARQFAVKNHSVSSAPSLPPRGKARIVFIQDENQDVSPFSQATVRFGLDGSWVGATKGRSYFPIDVDPGVHHLCANWQSSFKKVEKNADATSLAAEAGKTYYFSAAVTVESSLIITFAFSQLNEDQGKYRVKEGKLSTSTARQP